MLIAPRLKPAYPRLGELFAAAGIVSDELVEQSLVVAKMSKLPLGRVLILSGHLNKRELDGALRLQIMIKQGRLTREQSKELLRSVHQNQITIEDVLAQQHWQHAYSKPY